MQCIICCVFANIMDKAFENLQKVYDSESFRSSGYELVDLIAEHLKSTENASDQNFNNWKNPDQLIDFWATKDYKNDIASLFRDVINNSIQLHHPHYMGHQVSVPAPLSALAAMLSAYLNNGMAMYEMGASASMIEILMVQVFLKKIGFEQGDGIFTSGGTLANLTALLAARKAKCYVDIWEEGVDNQLGVFVSEEAHYCIDRAARIMGLGSKGIIKIPVNEQFKMRTELLPEYLENAKKQNIQIMAIVASAPSTSTGMYDDIEAICKFGAAHDIWVHVDAAHGGACLFSDRYKHLMNACNQADSVVIDTHKMLLTSALATALLFKKKKDSYANFALKAQYLWEEHESREWFNLGNRTFECTKHMMALKFYVLYQIYGESVFDQHVTYLYDLGKSFAKQIDSHKHFEYAVKPDSNIVCFRWLPTNATKSKEKINQSIRKRSLLEGKFYIVQTQLRGETWLRCSLMNPRTNDKHLKELLEYLNHLGIEICHEENI